MNDIKIPDGAPRKKSLVEVTGLSPSEASAPSPSDRVKVKFGKFVQLIATHDFEGAMKVHEDEDIVLSTNLLTDLANSHEEEEEKTSKLPIIFIVGVIIGVIVTYLIFRFK